MFEMIPFGRTARMAAYDPFRELEQLQRSFFGSENTASLFRTDVTDTGDAFKLEAELPGFKKENIELNIENDILTITAERKLDEEEKSKNFIKRERFYGSYSRSFDVSGVDIEGIDAEYTDGILSLTMPKKAEIVPPTRKLEIR